MLWIMWILQRYKVGGCVRDTEDVLVTAAQWEDGMGTASFLPC